MSYSGTVGQTLTTVQDFIDEGARRAGKLAEELTVEQVEAAKRSLYLLLSHMASKGINYWAIDKKVFGLNPYQAAYTLPQGSIDVLQALYRYVTRPTGTPSSDSGSPGYAFDGDISSVCQQTTPNGMVQLSYDIPQVQNIYISTIGFLPYVANVGSAVWTYVFQYSPDNVSWYTLAGPFTTAVTDNQWVWCDIEPGQSVPYYRMQALATPSLDTTLALRELVFGAQTTEIQMSRLNRDDYTNLPNKGFGANQPYQFWFDRKIDPVIRLWPTPNAEFVQMTVWYSRYVDDIGALSNQIEIPQYMGEAIQMQLAHRMALSLPGVPLERITYCEKMAQQYLYEAEEENRDRSPIFLAPNISHYSR